MIMVENPGVRPLVGYLRFLGYLFALPEENRIAISSLRRIWEKNSFTMDALPVVVVRMKVWSWYLVILAVFAALTLSSCALNQEGVAPNPAEMPDH